MRGDGNDVNRRLCFPWFVRWILRERRRQKQMRIAGVQAIWLFRGISFSQLLRHFIKLFYKIRKQLWIRKLYVVFGIDAPLQAAWYTCRSTFCIKQHYDSTYFFVHHPADHNIHSHTTYNIHYTPYTTHHSPLTMFVVFSSHDKSRGFHFRMDYSLLL